MDLEQIVQHILTSRRDLTREDILKRIYQKKQSAEDYYIDEVAARIVASELGIEIPDNEPKFQTEIPINHLVSGLNDVNIAGRVITVYPVQTFARPDMSQGRVARLLMADKTGRLKLVLWNDKAQLLESGQIHSGTILRVLHAYVREGYDGRLELHLGQRGQLEVSPSDLAESDYPNRDQLTDKVGSLTPKVRRATVVGVVCDAYPVSEFKRKDGGTGKVRRLRLRDETGEVSTVFWNEKTDELGDVQPGDQLRLTEARVKTQLDGRIELHVENATQIERLVGERRIPALVSAMDGPRRIADVKTEGGPVTIDATVASTPNIREVTTGQGEKIIMASFDLMDETGKIGITLWRKQAEAARELAEGSRVRIRNAYVKTGFSQLLELTTRASTVIEVLSKPEAAAPENKLE